MRHADAQHRATSDPSEGHAVKTGEREANGLGVTDVDGDFAGSGVGAGVVLTGQSPGVLLSSPKAMSERVCSNSALSDSIFVPLLSYVGVMVKVKGWAAV